MHVALLAALGPLGLNHSLGVLLWNAFFLVQSWLLFRATADERALADETFAAQMGQWWRDLATWPASRTNRLALGTVLAAMTWPVLEPLGYCDHWLAWAVYSARAETVQISTDVFHTGHINLTDRERSRLGVQLDLGTLHIGKWSLGTLGVPVYPNERFQLGVASAVLLTVQPRYPCVCVVLSARGRMINGRFERLVKPNDLSTELDRYAINAHPRLATYRATPK